MEIPKNAPRATPCDVGSGCVVVAVTAAAAAVGAGVVVVGVGGGGGGGGGAVGVAAIGRRSAPATRGGTSVAMTASAR